MIVTDKKDLTRILELQKEAFHTEAVRYRDFDMPPIREMQQDIEADFDRGVVFFKQVEQGHIVGTVRGFVDGDSCWIGRLCVDPSYQGRGVAFSLINELEAYFNDKCLVYRLFTGCKSAEALSLYRKLGYEVTSREEAGTYELVHLEKKNTSK